MSHTGAVAGTDRERCGTKMEQTGNGWNRQGTDREQTGNTTYSYKSKQ